MEYPKYFHWSLCSLYYMDISYVYNLIFSCHMEYPKYIHSCLCSLCYMDISYMFVFCEIGVFHYNLCCVYGPNLDSNMQIKNYSHNSKNVLAMFGVVCFCFFIDDLILEDPFIAPAKRR